MVKTSLARALNVADFAAMARAKLPQPVFAFLEGGAEDERTLARNRAAFDDYALLPHALHDVSSVDASAKVLGQELAWPMIVAPTGMPCLFHPQGETAIARAAAATGALYTLSTMASQSIEQVAAASPGPKAFQAYMFRDRGITRELVQRARDAGYCALILTVDVQIPANRERDKRMGMTLPPKLGLRSFSAFARKPAWCLDMVRHPIKLANFTEHRASPGMSLLSFINEQFDPTVSWNDIDFIRSLWNGPFAIKGLLRPEDARRAADAGADAVILSNHGGRQLDAAVSPLDMLPRTLAALDGAAEVVLDGGIRRGTDMVKAMALGASACMAGRPGLYGLAAAGPAGVLRVLGLLREEYERDLGLVGRPATRLLGRDVVQPVIGRGAGG